MINFLVGIAIALLIIAVVLYFVYKNNKKTVAAIKAILADKTLTDTQKIEAILKLLL